MDSLNNRAGSKTMDPEGDSPPVHNQYHEWDTDDELEMEYFRDLELDEVASSSSSSNVNSSKVDYFVSMKFPKKLVIRAIEENGEDNDDAILNSILTYLELAKTSGEDTCASSQLLPHYDDIDADSDEEDRSRSLLVEQDRAISLLLDMGYQLEDVVVAIEKCGCDAAVEELTDFICAMEMEKKNCIDLTESSSRTQIAKRRKMSHVSNRNSHVGSSRSLEPSKPLRIPYPMIGFGVPGMASHSLSRHIPNDVKGPPYFYYENVALTPKGVWSKCKNNFIAHYSA